MASQVDVCNMALRKLGQDIRIMSLSEESKNARIINSVWALVRDQVLSEHPWPFALVQAPLALQAQSAPDGWRFRYQVPVDCLNVVQVGPASSLGVQAHGIWQLRHGDQATSILSNDENASILYVRRVEDVGRWPPQFVDVVACKLAMETAISITGTFGGQMKTELLREYHVARSRAMVHQANQQSDADPFESPSLRARG